MSIAATFGSGGAEPYATALRRGELLHLRDPSGASVPMDVPRWNADADHTDLTLLSRATGPVLDIGCGPGRMVRAANRLGLHAIGLDVSAAAIEVASGLGGTYVQASVFDQLPAEGMWQTVLLADGNIGIGGDVPALLARCRDLLGAGGEIVVELHERADHERRFLGEVIDARGGLSAAFPWAEIGVGRLIRLLPPLGLEVVQAWELDGRSFARLATTR